MKKNFKAILINFSLSIFSIFFVIVSAECFFQIFSENLKPKISQSRVFSNSDYRFSSRYGELPTKAKYTDILSADDKIIYSSNIETDEFDRRIAPRPNSIKRRKHIIFWGCSYTFGTGVQNDETVPAQIEKLTNEFQVYNYGIPGSSPASWLHSLENRDLKKEIPQQSGIAIVYIYPKVHLNRLKHPMTIKNFYSKRPIYELEHNHLIFRGLYKDAYPYRTKLYELARRSALLQKISPSSFEFSDKEFSLAAAILKEMEKVYLRQFPNGKFLLAFHDSDDGNGFTPFLKSQGFQTIEFDPKLDQAEDLIPFDGHWNRVGNKKIASSILEKIRNLGWAK